MRVRILIIVLVGLLFSCSQKKGKTIKNTIQDLKKQELKYAKGFDIEQGNGFKLITIHNPWQGANKVEYKCLLVDKNTEVPDIKADFKIEVPIKNIVCLSTTHIGFLDILNETNSILGVSGKDYVNNKDVRNNIDKGKVVDVGFDNSLNYELITGLNPDLVITYGVGSQVAGYNQKLHDLGIKTVICGEYLENHPLGKLEWIKFIASFYKKEKEAEMYFNNVVKEYTNLLSFTQNLTTKPTVLFGLPYKESWYVPGGNSYLAKIIEDAGAKYIWDNNDLRKSVPHDIETVFVDAANVSVWLNPGAVHCKNDILKYDTRFKKFKPFSKSKIYNNNQQTSVYGGNNYWEKGLVEPHIVLKDLIKIFHPKLLPHHSLVYYKHIE